MRKKKEVKEIDSFIDSLNNKQLTEFISLFNSFYDNTHSITSDYLNVIHKDVSIALIKKVKEVEPVGVNRIGGMYLILFKNLEH